MFTASVSNLPAFLTALRLLDAELARAGDEAIERALGPTRNKAAGYAPKRSGELAGSIRAFRSGEGAGLRSTDPKGKPHEFGRRYQRRPKGRAPHTVDYSGHPSGGPPRFLYRAIREDRDRIQRAFADETVRRAATSGWLRGTGRG